MNKFAQCRPAESGMVAPGGGREWEVVALQGLLRWTAFALLGLMLLTSPAEAQSLAGGQASLDAQNRQARAHDFSYLGTAQEVERFVELGYLVPVVSTDDLEVHQVSFPYARPEVRVFLQRLGAQYRAACGEKLVVTSLTRPTSAQPRNASSRSVHPTGMAVDLRRSNDTTCRSWIESTLLALEGQGVLEATRERNPPHYHLAVFPDPYVQHVARITGNDRVLETMDTSPSVEIEWVRHTVRAGENLNLIARRYSAAVARIQAENGIRGSRIQAGQVLRIPVYRTVTRVASSAAGPDPGADAGSTMPEESAAPAADVASTDSGEPSPGGSDGVSDAEASSGSDVGTRNARRHVVARGESIWSIARRYEVSETAVRRANGLASSRIVVGQELTIPAASGPSPTPSESEQRSHEVRAGESLWAIARLYGVTIRELQDANGLASGAIHPGQRLDVPTGS